MTRRASSALLGIPPFLLGVSLAASSELAAGLLLYTGEGMIRALSVILSILLASLGIGIWSGMQEEGPVVPLLRKRWLFVFLAYVLAAVYAAGWGFLGEGEARGLSQGLGLAVLGALPVYAGGSLLAVMSREARNRTGHGAAPFALAALGGGAGSLLVGLFAGSRIIPPSFLLLCLVLLSGGSFVEALGLARLGPAPVEEGDPL
jgi:hypothetical protein